MSLWSNNFIAEVYLRWRDESSADQKTKIPYTQAIWRVPFYRSFLNEMHPEALSIALRRCHGEGLSLPQDDRLARVKPEFQRLRPLVSKVPLYAWKKLINPLKWLHCFLEWGINIVGALVRGAIVLVQAALACVLWLLCLVTFNYRTFQDLRAVLDVNPLSFSIYFVITALFTALRHTVRVILAPANTLVKPMVRLWHEQRGMFGLALSVWLLATAASVMAAFYIPVFPVVFALPLIAKIGVVAAASVLSIAIVLAAKSWVDGLRFVYDSVRDSEEKPPVPMTYGIATILFDEEMEYRNENIKEVGRFFHGSSGSAISVDKDTDQSVGREVLNGCGLLY